MCFFVELLKKGVSSYDKTYALFPILYKEKVVSSSCDWYKIIIACTVFCGRCTL